MPHHLQGVPFDPGDLDGLEPFERPGAGDPEGGEPLVRPTWWRWVAIAVIVAMAVAGPFAYVLARLLR
ncbi:MAG: hypothetical protein ACXWDS_04110 [Actinomycetota bacterium]